MDGTKLLRALITAMTLVVLTAFGILTVNRLLTPMTVQYLTTTTGSPPTSSPGREDVTLNIPFSSPIPESGKPLPGPMSIENLLSSSFEARTTRPLALKSFDPETAATPILLPNPPLRPPTVNPGPMGPLSREENERLQRECGRSPPGEPIGTARDQWAVTVTQTTNGSYVTIGSGILISPWHVLMSASLAFRSSPNCSSKGEMFNARYLYVNANDSCPPAICVGLNINAIYGNRLYVYPMMQANLSCPAGYENDIAILELIRPAIISSNVYPACLPRTKIAPQMSNDRDVRFYGYDSCQKLQENRGKAAECKTKYVLQNTTEIFCLDNEVGEACHIRGSGLVREVSRNDLPTAEVVGVLLGGPKKCNKDDASFNTERGEWKVYPATLALSVTDKLDFICSVTGVCILPPP